MSEEYNNFEFLLSSRQYDEAIVLSKTVPPEEGSKVLFRLGIYWLKGEGGKKNLSKSKNYLSDAVKAGSKDAIPALFDVYWEMGDNTSLEKMIELARSNCHDNPIMYERLSRAYWRGKGVPKDLSKASE